MFPGCEPLVASMCVGQGGFAPSHTIEAFEERLLKEPAPEGHVVITEKDLPVKHHFSPGLYARELWRPAGTFIIGHKHRTAHLCTLTKGRLNVFSEGRVTKHVAGDSWLASAGGRKATYVPLDCAEGATLITYHPTDKTDMNDLEKELIDKSPAFTAYELQQAQEAIR